MLSNNKNNKIVIILGTGATIASNYKKEGQPLPGDRGFFGNGVVKKKIEFLPALKLMLSLFRNKNTSENAIDSLEAFWTFLDFCPIYKNIYNLDEEKEKWWKDINKNKKDYQLDKLHCNTKIYIEDSSMQTNNEYSNIDLALLAGWELRLLIFEVYSELERPEEDVYLRLINKLHQNDNEISFVTFNYDCLLEASLNKIFGNKWFYPHIPSCENRDSIIKVLKLHGSLNWKMKGNNNFNLSTDYSEQPVMNITREENDFEQAAIVAPTQIKADLHKQDTQNPIWVTLLEDTWRKASEIISVADQVIVIGYSFPPTDYHIAWLFKIASSIKGQPYSTVTYCTKGDKIEDMKNRISQYFPANSYKLINTGLEDYIKGVNIWEFPGIAVKDAG